MSKVILLVFVVLFATTNASLVGEIFSAAAGAARDVVQLGQDTCNEAARSRIEVEKRLIEEKNDLLTSLRGRIGADYQKTLNNLYNMAMRETEDAKNKVYVYMKSYMEHPIDVQLTSSKYDLRLRTCNVQWMFNCYPELKAIKCLPMNVPWMAVLCIFVAQEMINLQAKRYTTIPKNSECAPIALKLIGGINVLVTNIETCRRQAKEKDDKLIREIDMVNNQALSTLDSLEASLTGTCIRSVAIRAHAAATTLKSGAKLSRASARLSLEQRNAKGKFANCIRNEGYTNFKDHNYNSLRKLKECVDKELS